ncbi:MAG TPA: MFS transporter [Ignavibacteriaceae bacterium]|nr:MFS transporter [Ignavibacteriaceae bacterium]
MKKTTPLTLIFLTVFIDLLGFGILIPILPAFATKLLGVDETAIGIAIAIYSFTQFFFNPILGQLSDKYGRKPVIVLTLLLNATGYLIFAFTKTYLVLLLSRIIAGIGGSSIGVAQAYIADVTTKEKRAKGMGLIGAAFGLGFVFGPMIGGYLSKFSYMVTGFGSASFSLMAFTLTLIFLPESNVNREYSLLRKRKLIDISSWKRVFRKPDLSLLIILFFILTFSVANIYGTFALLGYKVHHFSDVQNGYIYGIIGFSSALVQGGLLHFAAKFISEKRLIILGAFFMMTGLALIPYSGSFAMLAIDAMILSFGTGTLQPTILSLISEVASETEQGITLGINQSLSALGRVLGPLWGGFAFEFLGYPFPFLTGAAFTFIIMLLGIFYLPKIVRVERKVPIPGILNSEN